MADIKDILVILGKNIRTVRESKGITQLDLEVRSGIARSDISKIENGIINPASTTLIKLAIALEVELSEFYKTRATKTL